MSYRSIRAECRNVSASLGTALTENQARLIRRYTKNVILSYDADQAGQNAAMRGLDILYREDCSSKGVKGHQTARIPMSS